MKDKTYNKIMVLVCLILGLALVAIAITTHFVEKTERPTIYINHIVKQGEHLDDIANKYYADTYVLKARANIKKLNNMTESDLVVGQVIIVEVK